MTETDPINIEMTETDPINIEMTEPTDDQEEEEVIVLEENELSMVSKFVICVKEIYQKKHCVYDAKVLVFLIFFLLVEICLKWSAWFHPQTMNLIAIRPEEYKWHIVLSVTSKLNPGSAFGIMGSLYLPLRRSIQYGSACLALLMFSLTFSPRCTRNFRIGLYCYLFGAIGNTMDRLTVGGVIDYLLIDIHYYALSFNITDLLINVGLAYMAIALYYGDDKKLFEPSHED